MAKNTDLDDLKTYMLEVKADSINFKNLIANSKTSTKKIYYKKRLKKNNALLARVLVAYDKLLKLTNKANENIS